jgi:adenylate cyclase
MKKKAVAVLWIGLLCGSAGWLLARTGSVDRFEAATWSWRARAFARPGPATDRIRVILLDQESLNWGVRENAWPWPWPREVYGAILDFCTRGGARGIAFDVLFTEPSYMGEADDQAMGEAIARTPGFVGAVELGTERSESPDPEVLSRIVRPGLERPGTTPEYKALTAPIPQVLAAAPILGHVSGLPDEDGIFRRVAPFVRVAGGVVPSLGMALYLSDRPLPPERELPLDPEGYAILRFRGPSQTHRTVSAAAVIQSEFRLKTGEGVPVLDPEEFRDTYVFFGFSAPGLMDLRPSPVDPVYPGVELHATFLDNLLSGDLIRIPPPAVAGAAPFLAAFLAGLTLLGIRKSWAAAVAAAACLLAPVALGFGLYPAGWGWPVAAPWSSALLAVGSALLYNYSTEGRQKAFLKSAFRHYLSPVVIERILEDPSRLKLGGERRECSIFFSDLQGFSAVSEKLDPVRLTALLNDYLSDMTDILLEEGGTLDKYEGDAIIAFWNAPLAQPDHAVRAVRAGLRCQRKLAERREEFEERSGVVLRMRVGIHTGEVVVGNLGSRERFDYTVLGDAANLASRLEGANKAFGTYSMVSEATWQKTAGVFSGRELGRLRVVGRAAPVRVFEPLGDARDPEPAFLPAFAGALALFAKGELAAAGAAFEAVAGQDPAAKAYARRCREELTSGRPADGIWTLDSK